MHTRTFFASAVSAVALIAAGSAFAAPTKTAQSVGVNLQGAGNYAITQTETYQFDVVEASTYYSNVLTSGPVVTCNGNASACASTNKPTAFAPPPLMEQVSGLGQGNGEGAAKKDRCTFLDGGTLHGRTYKQSVTSKGLNNFGNWTFEWTYTVAPLQTVDSFTAWDLISTGGSAAEISFDAAIAGESVQVTSTRTKYSFSLKNSDGTNRVQNLELKVTGPIPLTGIAPSVTYTPAFTVATGVNFLYNGNAGKFGAVQAALLDGDARGILNGTVTNGSYEDNFSGNNNGGSDGSALALATMDTVNHTFSSAGSYTVTVTGNVKGNAAEYTSDQPFSITSNVTISTPGCGGN